MDSRRRMDAAGREYARLISLLTEELWDDGDRAVLERRKSSESQLHQLARLATVSDLGRLEHTREAMMHGGRHFYASLQLESGMSPRALADYLGHSDPAYMMRTYTHVMPTSEAMAREAVDDLFDGLVEMVRTPDGARRNDVRDCGARPSRRSRSRRSSRRSRVARPIRSGR